MQQHFVLKSPFWLVKVEIMTKSRNYDLKSHYCQNRPLSYIHEMKSEIMTK